MCLKYYGTIYAAEFPDTWEQDLQIADLLEQDYEVWEVAQALGCTHEAVYETVERVKAFLFPGMTDDEIMAYSPDDE